MKLFSIIDSDRAFGKERANMEVDHIMRERGADVRILINSIADKSIREEICGFQFYEIPFPRNIGGRKFWWRYVRNFILTQFYIIKLIRKEQPDYILLPTEIALSYLYFPLHFTKAKKIFRCGDSPLIYRKQGVITSVYGFLWKKFILKQIDIVVSNALFIQNQIAESGRELCDKDALIYNYPPIRINKTDNAVYKFHPGILRIGFIGRIVEDKGVRELVYAVRQLNEKKERVVVYLCGDTTVDKKYGDELFNISDSNIEFIGLIKDLEKFYENVDIIVIPSIYPEPMANVLTEAKFHRKAVVIFNLGGMPEIVKHKHSGYICPEVSIQSLVEGIKYYLDNPGLIKEHGENAYRSIEELGLTKENYTEKWMKVFS